MGESTTHDAENSVDLTELGMAFPNHADTVRESHRDDADAVAVIGYETDDGDPVVTQKELQRARDAGFSVHSINGKRIYFTEADDE